MMEVPRALADVGEAPRHEIAGGEAPTVRRALSGFGPCSGAGGGRRHWREFATRWV